MMQFQYKSELEEYLASFSPISTDSFLGSSICDHYSSTAQPAPRELGNTCPECIFGSEPYEVESAPFSPCIGTLFCGPIELETDYPPLFDPSASSIEKEPDDGDHKHMLDLDMPGHGSIDPWACSNLPSTCGIVHNASCEATYLAMTPTQSFPISKPVQNSSLWAHHDSCLRIVVPDRTLSGFAASAPDQSLSSTWPQHNVDGHSQLFTEGENDAYDTRRTISVHHQSDRRSSRHRPPIPESVSVHIKQKAMCRCDYVGCHKAFRRNEHLKRHKQT